LSNTTSAGGIIANETRNRGVSNRQVSGVNFQATATTPVLTTIDTTSDVALLWQINIATATDWMVCQGAIVEMLPTA
jgi:hypothetical protein